jgi:hypothetical protein
MAEADFTQSTIPLPMYHDERTIDRLTRKSSQLTALITTTVGGGFEAFNLWNDTIKENFLWACADLAKEVEETSRILEVELTKK